jgi:Peptidase A4 family
MRRILRAWTAAALGAAVALAAGQASAAAGTAASPTGRAATGCAGAVVVQPPRPGTPAAKSGSLAALYTMATKHHAIWLTSMTCTIVKRSHVPATAAGNSTVRPSTTYTTGNWSGYQTSDTPAFTTGEWTLPTILTPPGGSDTTIYYSADWVGIGAGLGSGSGALIQAGTEEDALLDVPRYYAWFEIVNGAGDTGGQVKLTGLTVNAGDAMWTGIQYPAGPGKTYVGVCDMTTNTCVDMSSSTSAPGDSAEWIVEAPSLGSTVTQLADFGSLTFTDACEYAVWPNGTCRSISSSTSPAAIQLYQNNQVVAAPGPLNAAGTGFTDYYL